jgi:monoamine oxidase
VPRQAEAVGNDLRAEALRQGETTIIRIARCGSNLSLLRPSTGASERHEDDDECFSHLPLSSSAGVFACDDRNIGLYVAPQLLNPTGMLDRHVIIAGAGLAGLTAAHQLARDGYAVTVIEARDRIGGRAWTVRGAPFVDAAYAELGGEFIDADHRRIRALATAVGTEIVRVLRHGFTLRFRNDQGGFQIDRGHGWNELRELLAPLIRDYKRSHGAVDAERFRELSKLSVRDWLRRAGAPPHIHALTDAMRGFFLADAEDLSALPMAAELGQAESPTEIPMYRIAGGNDRFLDAIVRATPAQVLLQHRLAAVRHATDRVMCTVIDDCGHQQEMTAAALIITVPASVLADIDIAPRLPETQERAIRTLRYGCATKVVLQTSSDLFGSSRARAFATDVHVGAFWDASEGQTPGAHVVSFLAGGSASPLLGERVRHGGDHLVGDLCWLRRGTAPRVRAVAAWTWEHDPLARGGYAYLDPSFDPAWIPLLRRRHGRLFFAGEHTSEDFQGYMEGAVESGERVAEEVVNV